MSAKGQFRTSSSGQAPCANTWREQTVHWPTITRPEDQVGARVAILRRVCDVRLRRGASASIANAAQDLVSPLVRFVLVADFTFAKTEVGLGPQADIRWVRTTPVSPRGRPS